MTTDCDLLSLVLTLRPMAAEPLPSLGRAAHAVLLDAVRQSDPALAESLHTDSGLRPFTVSGLIGASRRAGLDPERTYRLRFTALTRAVASALLTATEGGILAVGRQVRLDECVFHIEGVDRGLRKPDCGSAIPNLQSAIENPTSSWAGTTTYESLAAPWLVGRSQPEARLALHFASPTTFKSGGLHVPAPLPALVFGSLLEKWNAFAPVALPAEVRRFAQECVGLSAYRLSTRMPPSKDGGLRAGAVGVARYTAVNPDRYWLSLIHVLADFAFYSGVGAGTTMGFGQCRRIPDFAGQRRPHGYAVPE